ncbi:hypothetical protein [Nocardioides sambongensis]|uniref:hypothetical protein n=1 Tax=Nocardioides sambongensis TaxID=2589074 RepID=UPI00112C006F|nr:hypothetical protein [Nocardioides sambongensis]
MDSHTEQPDAAADPLARLIESLTDAEYVVEQPLPGVLRVEGRFSNTERIALQAAADAARPVAIWAVSHRNDWTLVAWNRPELVCITQRGEAPQRWRHRQLPAQLRPDAQTFLEGAASAFDIVTRPKHRPTDAAREVLGGFGITDAAPPGWVPPVVEAPPVVQTTVPAETNRPRRAAAPKAAKPKPAAKPEPVTPVCPTCFMALPATGICDNCG